MVIKGNKQLISAIAGAVAAFVLLNVAADYFLDGIRFDLTGNSMYTLSEGTIKITKSLEKKINMKVFYTRDEMNGIPYLKSYASRVTGLLRQYEAEGNNIELEFIDPEPFSEQEDKAVSSGIQPVPVDTRGGKLYFGMIISDEEDNSRVIPFFDPEREPFLEYEITSKIYEITNPSKPVVGIISTIGRQNGGSNMIQGYGEDQWVIFDQLEDQFEILNLGTDINEIPGKTDLLLIVHPYDITESAAYAIEQFIMSGGHAVIFTDPYLEAANAGSKSSGLPEIYKQLGVKFHSDKVIIDEENALTVNYGGTDRSVREMTKLNWIMLQGENFNDTDIVTSGLGQLRFASAGYFTKIENDSTEWKPLVSSGRGAVSVDPSLTHSPVSILQNYISSDKSEKDEFVIAARIHGILKSSFSGKEGDGHPERSMAPANVIVVGDVDMLRDMFWVRKQSFLNREYLIQTADNATFLNNSLDNLSGSDELISLRSRSRVERPFEVVNKLRLEAEKKYLNKEKRLRTKLEELNTRLNEFGDRGKEDNPLVSGDLVKKREKFREEMVNTRKQLRDVKHKLYKDIDRLGTILKFANIVLLPVIVLVLAFFVPRVMGIKKS